MLTDRDMCHLDVQPPFVPLCIASICSLAGQNADCLEGRMSFQFRFVQIQMFCCFFAYARYEDIVSCTGSNVLLSFSYARYEDIVSQRKVLHV